MEGQSFLVTGGAGFIGSHLARALLDRGARVTVLDDLSTGRRDRVPAGADLIEVDAAGPGLEARLEGRSFDGVLHLAGQSSGEASFLDPLRDLNSHVLTTFRLLEWCRKSACPRFLYASSMAAYGNPLRLPVDEDHPQNPRTYYAAGKVSAEAYIRLFRSLGLKTTILRLFSVYGPGQDLDNKLQGMVSIYLSYALEGRPILVRGSRERFRDLVFVGDVVDAWLACLGSPATHGKTYNVASGRKTTVEEILRTILEVLGDPDHPIVSAGETPGDQFGVVGDPARLRADTGWSPRVSLAEGLEKMVEHHRHRMEERGQ